LLNHRYLVLAIIAIGAVLAVVTVRAVLTVVATAVLIVLAVLTSVVGHLYLKSTFFYA
jgi:hypothetical protein